MVSELQLTRIRVRDLVPCPKCEARARRRCWKLDRNGSDLLDSEGASQWQEANHQARVEAARAVVRARRLESSGG